MEFQPETETGKRLVAVLANWMKKSPELAVDRLKRLFLMNSLKVKNKDGFVAALYGQNVLDETPSVLSWRFPSTLLRVQYGMEITLNKRRAKELVVALELSENQNLLSEVFAWTQKNSKEIQESINSVLPLDPTPAKVQKPKEIQSQYTTKRSSSIDLAPVRVPKRKSLSEIRAGAMTPRYREISWNNEGQRCTVLEVCINKIIVGGFNGQIKIYDSANLTCQTVLNPGRNKVWVTCLQCTCTEIIAGYNDGNICVWNIQRGILVRTISHLAPGSFSTCMRWRAPKLVVGTNQGRIHIYQKVNSSLTALGTWDAQIGPIRDVDFTEYYVIILQSSGLLERVDVDDFNGQLLGSISSRGGILQMALHGNHLITCDRRGTLEIWNIDTGDCLKELTGPVRNFGFDPREGVIATCCNRSDRVLVGNVDSALLERSQRNLSSFPHCETKCLPFDMAIVDGIKVGPNFLVATCGGRRNIFVTDFLA